jgi:BetI-type transcriptional repressor, C-terminal
LSAKEKRMFALEFSALLDGLSIQVALEDPEVDSDLAYDIAMHFAERELNLPPAKKRLNDKVKAIKKS